MSNFNYETTFKVKRAFASTLERLNPVLAAGEPAYELDTQRLKIGDGTTHYNELNYVGFDSIDQIKLIDGGNASGE